MYFVQHVITKTRYSLIQFEKFSQVHVFWWNLHNLYAQLCVMTWRIVAGLEDKASACDMLVCYARELKEGFAEYAEQVVRLMVPLFKFYFHDGVRTAAAESLPHLLECAQIKGPVFLEVKNKYK